MLTIATCEVRARARARLALIKLDCTREELDEMLSVSVYMGGGPALMYAAEALKAWDTMTSAT
ncbi:MAG: carboxymuconolactone decarboxylase family protein [Rhodoferax sp.]